MTISAAAKQRASRLQGVVFAQQYLMLDYDCPVDLLARATAITPGSRIAHGRPVG